MKSLLGTIEANRGSIGIAFGFMLGCAVTNFVAEHPSAPRVRDVKLDILAGDIIQMKRYDKIAVYETNVGKMYVSMDLDKLRNL